MDQDLAATTTVTTRVIPWSAQAVCDAFADADAVERIASTTTPDLRVRTVWVADEPVASAPIVVMEARLRVRRRRRPVEVELWIWSRAETEIQVRPIAARAQLPDTYFERARDLAQRVDASLTLELLKRQARPVELETAGIARSA